MSAKLLQGALAFTLAAAAALLATPPTARADEWGLGGFRDPLATRDAADDVPHLALDGYLRLRGDEMVNFDLDRGPTPSTGQTLYPLPLSDPGSGDALSSGNMRLRLVPRLDLGWEVSVHMVVDCLDDVGLGSTPSTSTRWAAMGAASTTQQPPQDSIQVKRAWGEALTPFGMILAGRMGVHWGLGVVANDGNCLDCDFGDTVDGVGLVLPVLGHALGASYDVAASGPNQAGWGTGGPPVDLDPADDVRSVSLALLRYNAPAVHGVLLAGGRSALDYGLVWSHRWQRVDFPTWSAASAGTGSSAAATGTATGPGTGSSADGLPTASQAVARDFSGDLFDAFFRWESPRQALELEAVLLRGRIGDASLVPGLSTDEVQALQYGGVVRETLRPLGWLEASLELGLASGDPAPGFGARPGRDRDVSRAGDLDGPQLQLPGDRRVDNLRFHPDYHVDLILWRELVGTVTDALYVRPRVQVGPWQGFTAEAVVIYSQAMEPTSPPGGKEPLGVETDLALRYRSRDGFVLGLEYGLLVPLAGLDNAQLGLDAKPAQRLHGLLGFVY